MLTPIMRPYLQERLFSEPICAKEERNCLPNANQGLSRTKPRHGHADAYMYIVESVDSICRDSADTQ